MENNKNTQVVKHQGSDMTQGLNSFGSIKGFEDTQRMAVALSKSTIVPKEYQSNVGNCMIALDISSRVGLSPMMVMQNLYVVNGRPSWGSQSIAAMINNSRKYAEPLQYSIDGKGDSLSCYVYTKDYDDKEVKGPTITMQMAKEEGWISKAGSKWKTMPEVMIRYRATSFFGRLYCSELLMGIYAEDENKDMDPIIITVKDVISEVKEEVKESINDEVIDIPVEEIQEVNEAPKESADEVEDNGDF